MALSSCRFVLIWLFFWLKKNECHEERDAIDPIYCERGSKQKNIKIRANHPGKLIVREDKNKSSRPLLFYIERILWRSRVLFGLLVLFFSMKLLFWNILKFQNISAVSQTSDQISDYYWWKDRRSDLNNLQRNQTETKYLSTLSVSAEMYEK